MNPSDSSLPGSTPNNPEPIAPPEPTTMPSPLPESPAPAPESPYQPSAGFQSRAQPEPIAQPSPSSFAAPAVVSPATAAASTDASSPESVATSPMTPANLSAATNLDMPAAPTPGQVVTSGSDTAGTTSNMGSNATSGGKRRKKLFLFIAATIALLLVLGGGYIFAFYIPNSPNGVYASSMEHNNRAYDMLVSYQATQAKQQYKGADVTGSFTGSAGGASADGTFTSQSSGGNSTGQVKLDVLGEKLTANFRSVQPGSQKTPDIYIQATGFKSMLQGYGLPQFAKFDGQWIAVDHTLLDSAANSAGAKTGSGAPTQAQIQDAMKRLGSVNQQYLFTTNKDKAVMVKQKNLGKSTQDGRTVYGYQMGYSKTNLKNYINAVASTMDASSFNTWVKGISGGKSLSEAMDVKSLVKSVDSAKSDYTFTMYVDTQTKLVRQLHFNDVSDPTNNFFTVGVGYTGGDSLPFTFGVHAKNTSTITDTKLAFAINTSTNKITGDVTMTSTTDGSPTKVTANFTATPSNKPVTVTAPAGAIPVLDLLRQAGLSNTFGGGAGTSLLGASSAANPFVLTQ